VAADTSGDVATPRSLAGALIGLPPPPPAPSPDDPLASGSGATGPPAAASLEGQRGRRRVLFGRLAAVFYTGSGLLGLVTLPLPAPTSNRLAVMLVSAVALAVGIAAWFVPWGRLPRRASLWLVPPGFAMIAVANVSGGSDLRAYGVFFVVAFVWIGVAQRPRTSLAIAPLAVAAYVVPLAWMPGGIAAGLPSAATTIPICMLVGEGIAWGMARLEQIERALHVERDRADQLRELDRMKDTFLSAVSHELRTPLTICRGHLDVMDTGAGEHEVRAVKETLLDELGLMGRLVEDLTTLARAGDGTLLKLESLSLSEFVGGIVAMAEPILGDRLQVDAATTGAALQADRQRLTQALLNLLQNAAGHARDRGPVRLRVRSGQAGWSFEVADNGGGLPPGEEQLVFEAFRTGSSPTGRTGLGLSIAREIARAHGGECGLWNRPGRGATFWIRIPR
jgi:signal transduction histidine kinase